MEEEPVILQEGQGADHSFQFEVRRVMIGRTIKAVRYCSEEEVQPGMKVATVTMDFTDGGRAIFAVEGSQAVIHFLTWVTNPEKISTAVM